MPNLLAELALTTYPIVGMAAFAVAKPPTAVALILVVGQLVLPSNISYDFPLLPPLDKNSGPCFAAFLGTLLFARSHLRGVSAFKGSGTFMVLILLGSLGTRLTNRDPLVYGPMVLPGESIYSFVSDAIRGVLTTWAPFFLGRSLLKSPTEYRAFWKLIVVAGLIYTLPILIELRMSPQINSWVYGYFPSDWGQAVRGSGYRPLVFFNHGLPLAFFMSVATMGALGLARAGETLHGLSMWVVWAYLLVILLLCRSSGAAAYAVASIPLVLLLQPRTVIRAMWIVGVLICVYPVLRINGLIPVDSILHAALDLFGPQRTESLAFRFTNENLMIPHSQQRLLFGWGGYGRNFVFNDEGIVQVVVDGFAILVLTTRGLVGYVGVFGLLSTPLFYCARRFKRLVDRTDRVFFAQVSIFAACLLVDLTINAVLSPYLYMLLGGLEGAATSFGSGAEEGGSGAEEGEGILEEEPPADDRDAHHDRA